MKCIEKDRGRRYESASGLAADLRRYLEGEAVTAAPPSRVYLAGKFMRRNKGLVGGAAAVGVLGAYPTFEYANAVPGVVASGVHLGVLGSRPQVVRGLGGRAAGEGGDDVVEDGVEVAHRAPPRRAASMASAWL